MPGDWASTWDYHVEALGPPCSWVDTDLSTLCCHLGPWLYHGFRVLLNIMSGSMNLQRARACDDVHGLCHHQGPNGCPGSGSPLVTMLGTEGHAAAGTVIIWVASTATSDHGVNWTELMRGWGMSRSMSPMAARVCVDVRGSRYH